MDGLDHHYQSHSSARNSIVQWLHKGIIKGVVIDDSEKPYRLYPEGHEATNTKSQIHLAL